MATSQRDLAVILPLGPPCQEHQGNHATRGPGTSYSAIHQTVSSEHHRLLWSAKAPKGIGVICFFALPITEPGFPCCCLHGEREASPGLAALFHHEGEPWAQDGTLFTQAAGIAKEATQAHGYLSDGRCVAAGSSGMEDRTSIH